MLLHSHASLVGRPSQQHLTCPTVLQVTTMHGSRAQRWAPFNPVKHRAIPNEDAQLAPSTPSEEDNAEEDTSPAPRDDDVCAQRLPLASTTRRHPTTLQVLPDSLTDALAQAAASTALAIERGASRCVVEILLAEFWDPVSGAVFNEEGDQMRWWKLSKRFVENLQEISGGRPIKVV